LILDSSAMISMIEAEDGHEQLLAALTTAVRAAIGAPTLFETARVLIGREGVTGQAVLSRFVERNEIAAIPFGERHASLAAEAFARFGKGRHPARLNYGDCMSYATARLADEPLLFIGDDFRRTDITPALR